MSFGRNRTGILLLFAAITFLLSGPLLGQVTVIRGGWLFDGTGNERVANPGIVIQAGKILAVGEEGRDWEISQVFEVGSDHTILPGFIDLHAHYAVDFFGKGRVDETQVYPLLFMANGVTSTFPAGEIDPDKMRRLRIEIDEGRRVGPRILNSGPYFGTARYGWNRDIRPAQIEAEVDEWARKGVRGFKAKNITAPHLKALLSAAHRHGLTVTAHLNSGVGESVNPRDAIVMGIDRVEHFLGGDALDPSRHAYASWRSVDVESDEFKSVARLYIDHRVYFDATIAAFGSFGAVESPVFEDFA
ncbi:MAG TPA: amidohydrolase family protein [Acidobacteriota bacterium]|nr:amidohydrolase family protein [Acidobacteriota bacterium]